MPLSVCDYDPFSKSWVLGVKVSPEGNLTTDPFPLVFVVGQAHGPTWELAGVFGNQEEADRRARELPGSVFVGPVRMNSPLPTETVEWPGLDWYQDGERQG